MRIFTLPEELDATAVEFFLAYIHGAKITIPVDVVVQQRLCIVAQYLGCEELLLDTAFLIWKLSPQNKILTLVNLSNDVHFAKTKKTSRV